jgi:cation:H+ antiporter
MAGPWSLPVSVAIFIAAAIVIGAGGTRLVRLLDGLADRTGLGEAFFGMALLGAITSLSGLVLSLTAALDELPELAVSNAVGGIAVQTTFLVAADFAYRRANLEHAAASLPNLVSAATLVMLLAFALAASFGPEGTVLEVHPVSVLLVVSYLAGLRTVHIVREKPSWHAARSSETREDVPDENLAAETESLTRAWAEVAALAAITAIAGWSLARAGATLAADTVLSTTVVGALFTATATSLPELVTTIAAVRRGALTLAVGGIVGGNSFDVLTLSLTDVAYRPGSLYHAIEDQQLLVIAVTIAMTGVLLIGLLARQRRAVLAVGGEGVVIALLYVVMLALVAVD